MNDHFEWQMELHKKTKEKRYSNYLYDPVTLFLIYVSDLYKDFKL